MKSLKSLLDRGDLKTHRPTKNEIDGIRKLISRDIKDSDIVATSVDRRFATVYNAALNLARVVVISNGYRITAKVGHHKVSFSSASKILGNEFDDYFFLFEICRRKRNKVDYDQADVATEKELTELIIRVKSFEKLIFEWLAVNHSEFI